MLLKTKYLARFDKVQIFYLNPILNKLDCILNELKVQMCSFKPNPRPDWIGS